MKRTIPPANQTITNAEMLQTLEDLTSRMKLASSLGQQYGGNRDLYEALGYKKELTTADFWNAYLRQDIARKVNNFPVNSTWRGEIKITDGKDDSPFTKEFEALADRTRLWNKITRVDRLTGLGQYAILVLGFDDVQNPDQFRNQVTAGENRRLLYVHAYSERSVEIEQWETDTKSERYGLPLLYKIKTTVPGDMNTTRDLLVHHSRVVHVAEELLESEVYGVPRLQGVYNRLDDLAKIVGGSAEMFWRGARPGYAAKTRENARLGPQDKSDLDQQFDEFEHELRRWMRIQGMDIESLAPQVSDPSNHVDVQLNMISGHSYIPKRMLIGSERGELSSQQDETNWNQYIDDRRDSFAEPMVLRPLVDRLIAVGTLPTPEKGEYQVEWPDLWTPSEKERSEIASNYSSAIKSYSSAAGASSIVPEKAFLREILGWSEEAIQQAFEELETALRDEEEEARRDQQTIEEETEEEGEGSVQGGGEEEE